MRRPVEGSTTPISEYYSTLLSGRGGQIVPKQLADEIEAQVRKDYNAFFGPAIKKKIITQNKETFQEVVYTKEQKNDFKNNYSNFKQFIIYMDFDTLEEAEEPETNISGKNNNEEIVFSGPQLTLDHSIPRSNDVHSNKRRRKGSTEKTNSTNSTRGKVNF
jgi:hypothetical protein